MNLSSKRTSKFLIFYDVLRVILIVFQINNSVSSRLQDLNLTNGNYVSDILRRFKRQQDIVSNCQIPNYGLHTRYAILAESRTTTRQSGDYAQQFNILEVSCDRGYKPKPLTDNRTMCINGQWNPPLTINCTRTCTSLTSIISTTVRCKYHDIHLENCNDPIEETTAFLSCNSLYEQDGVLNNQIRLCRAGRWTPGISECSPVCGIKRPKETFNIIKGQNAIPGDFPWQIGIYNARKEYICGGSIIVDRHIILTAAHCVTDNDGNVQPVENYSIAAGKYYRKYDDDKDKFAQYSKILRIYVPERYTGLSTSFALDIAILILTDPFTISEEVQPLCIELNQESPYLHLSLTSNGVVTGWGYTSEGRDLSEVLKELVVPYIPFRKCFEEMPDRFKRFITPDKLCGGYLNSETSICGGDSGGALVFKNILSDRYYVKGIVSTSPATEEFTCDSNQYNLYTSANYHLEFIRNILAYNQLPQSIEITTKDVTNEETDERLDIDICTSEDLISEMLRKNGSAPPQIIPKDSQVTINATLNFQLRCLSKNFVTWTYPNNVETILRGENLTKYSTITIQSSKCDTVYASILTISNTSYLDVGFYYCHHENTTDFTDSTKSSSIYVFVYDDAQLYLMPKYINMTVTEYSIVTCPCRRTARDVRVSLMTNRNITAPSKSYYNSKIGFRYNQTAGVGNYIFWCKFSRGEYVQTTNIDMSVIESV